MTPEQFEELAAAVTLWKEAKSNAAMLRHNLALAEVELNKCRSQLSEAESNETRTRDKVIELNQQCSPPAKEYRSGL